MILLPERDGRGTAVTVHQGERHLVIDQPYAGALLGRAAGLQAIQSSAEAVQAAFAPALAAQPQRPVSFQLYFVEGSLALTGESKAALERVFAEIAARPAPEVSVVGHTDSLGAGVENVQAFDRGERELIVPTGDEVAEPRNRRVEVTVR